MLTIQDQLGVLKQLQTVDTDIYRLRKERQAQPLLIDELNANLRAERQRLTQLETQYKTLQTQHKSQELELATHEEKIKKLQGQLFQVKTNKEYTAMQHEIEAAKADNSLLEETIITLLEQIDQTQAQTGQAKKDWQQREVQVQQEIQHAEGEMVTLDAALHKADADRQRLTPSLDPQILAQYERVLRNRHGLALVPLVGEACGGCHMVLPPQIANEVSQQKQLVSCDNCARLLYYDEP